MGESKGPRLSMRHGGDEVILPLVLRETLIGRIDSNHVVLDDPEVSRIHARLLLLPDGVDIEDCGSSIGTLVNGEMIDRARLQNGDVVSIGPVALTFLLD